MATKQAFKRLTKEYQTIQANPPPFIIARPLESDILEWHYVITGPKGSPYEGEYHGKLIFPSDYPFKPPAIKMVTPNGRFEVNMKLCLSMSDYHPSTWNPAWSVSTILTGLLSFMLENESTTGSIRTTAEEKRRLAKSSHAFNRANHKFREVFPELAAKTVEQQSPPPPESAVRLRTTASKPTADDAKAEIAPTVAAPERGLAQMAWDSVRSNILRLIFGGLVMYIVILKVMTRLAQ
ncbi:ubiquitin-conjugating enzyme/RWD-like protein [Polychytrium aggregatum]|uniref:ubiquitin-conjugating enzyme/RWD-like protein n=1 Tax=Polychytrium aggregatum TaxID=110093 RepID=UPI0022FDC32C|nr:ubiquitin-conjugating enzyme/RWD-like protein [Polychytrium aggregatum]KAI9199807.1 ubiquitin-conjugating enzyme/RWD-like protein [Polychytrium aggregatum]